jgi:hypothetical protein
MGKENSYKCLVGKPEALGKVDIGRRIKLK